MNDAAKIALSPEELELVQNTRWILTKQHITGKLFTMLGEVAEALQRHPALPELARTIAPKISRGEHYRQLPYVMLDYPRLFEQSDTLAIRTFFWWGNYFSVSLQVAGRFLPAVETAVADRASWLAEQGYRLCVHTDPWEHGFEPEYFMPLQEWVEKGRVPAASANGFLKIARSLPVDRWAEAPHFILESADQLLSLLPAHQAPSR